MNNRANKKELAKKELRRICISMLAAAHKKTNKRLFEGCNSSDISLEEYEDLNKSMRPY